MNDRDHADILAAAKNAFNRMLTRMDRDTDAAERHADIGRSAVR